MATTNDPKTIAKLLRAIAGGTDAKARSHDVIFNAAADMLDPPERCRCSPARFCTCGLRYQTILPK